jgi:shikimate dehydrogenase
MTSPALQEIVAVLGSPAAGNPTQYLFERALLSARIDWRLVTCEVAPERLAEAVAGAAAMGFRGCVLSGPLRELAFGLADSTTPALLERTAAGFVGHVTDGRGVIEAVRGHGDPADRDVLVVGAGPTARATALELALAGAARIWIAAEATDQAAALAADIAGLDRGAAETLPWGESLGVPKSVEIVILTARAPALTGLGRATLLVSAAPDVDPPPAVTSVGCCCIEGIEVQAARAAIDFQTLTGLEPDVEMLREALDEYLS